MLKVLDKIIGLPAAALRIGGIAAIVAALFGWFVYDQRKIGGQKMLKKVEIANASAVKKAGAAGAATYDPSARGLRDPYVRPPD